MLDAVTKRRIDSARDILVGKVPDPKSQVEQITIALIYKFMDDMDAEAADLGGERKFFAGEYERYGWQNLISPGLGGQRTLELYMEAIGKMPENPGIPALFRDIFKNAYLPYRDPETLRQFLKIINEFEYDHSERLGDAFEYLLSVLGSQGDAGQFRTPRHIIDFIVRILDPKKDEKVLDPACGTAGFLISAYKHIMSQNRDADGSSTLSTDERLKMATNFLGYDISPDMVRLSLVNLYLHGFTDPHIYEYDTLTSQDRWKETADVILANPPFMSPKGGIQPHNRFSVKSNRSEVLFVDYIAEHLTPNGRAGIVVPEGIIFQSQTAYKALRKMLVEEYLVAVISLPAGVFNPYSGVKTSILILDRSLAKNSDTVAFFKVENDGFGLGAQRRTIEKNDLPQVEAELATYIDELRNSVTLDTSTGYFAQVVLKEAIAGNGDYNLSVDRYQKPEAASASVPMLELGQVCAQITDGSHFSPESTATGFPYVTVKDLKKGRIDLAGCKTISETSYRQLVSTGCQPKFGDILFSKDGTVGKTAIVDFEKAFVVLSSLAIITPRTDVILPEFLYHLLSSNRFIAMATDQKTGVAIRRVVLRTLKTMSIPVPPLDVQREIVAEIEGYQRIIDGARAVVDNYRPQIPIHPDWPTPSIADAPVNIIDGDRGSNYPSKEDFQPSGYCLFLNTKNVRADGFRFDDVEFIDRAKDLALRKGKLERGDVVLTTRGTVGNTAVYDESVAYDHLRINSGMLIFRPDTAKLSSRYLFLFFQSENFKAQREAIVSGSAQPQLPIRNLKEAFIPLPDLEMQNEIVAEIEAEQALVNANRELITRFEQKIQTTLARVWGDE